jgi:hypothetical protein
MRAASTFAALSSINKISDGLNFARHFHSFKKRLGGFGIAKIS